MPQPFVIIGVLGFYCIISIFANDSPLGSLTNNFRFFFSLFNINIG